MEVETEIAEASVEATAKSLAKAVVAPNTPITVMVQGITAPTRCGLPKPQLRVEAVVGVP